MTEETFWEFRISNAGDAVNPSYRVNLNPAYGEDPNQQWAS